MAIHIIKSVMGTFSNIVLVCVQSHCSEMNGTTLSFQHVQHVLVLLSQ